MPHQKVGKHSFFNAICYAVRYFLARKKTPCDEVEVENDLPDHFYKKMLDLKESLMFDLRINSFERQCLEVNELLISEKLFLRVYMLKNKFRHLIHSDPKKTM